MNENEKSRFVLVLLHDSNNSYGERAFANAKSLLKGKGVVQISTNVYIVILPDAMPALIAVGCQEIRVRHEVSRVEFCLIPCGSSVFGELPKEVAKPLVDAGLTYQEIPIPDAPR